MHPIGETPDGQPFADGTGWEVKFGGNVKLVSLQSLFSSDLRS